MKVWRFITKDNGKEESNNTCKIDKENERKTDEQNESQSLENELSGENYQSGSSESETESTQSGEKPSEQGEGQELESKISKVGRQSGNSESKTGGTQSSEETSEQSKGQELESEISEVGRQSGNSEIKTKSTQSGEKPNEQSEGQSLENELSEENHQSDSSENETGSVQIGDGETGEKSEDQELESEISDAKKEALNNLKDILSKIKETKENGYDENNKEINSQNSREASEQGEGQSLENELFGENYQVGNSESEIGSVQSSDRETGEKSENQELESEISDAKKEALNNLKEVLSKIKETKEKKEEASKQEEKKEVNRFLEELKNLANFDERQTSDEYSIDTSYDGEIPDSVIRTLINKFLTGKFIKHDTTLNTRASSLEKSKGYYKWDYIKLVTHLETDQVTKIPNDKYDYKPAQGKSENVPFSFYFDLSGSMSEYTGMLALIAIELLKKDVKVLVGYNSTINVQIDKIKGPISISDFSDLLTSFGNYGYTSVKDKLIREKGIEYRIIKSELDDYLLSKKAEKCLVFTDFDPFNEVVNLSKNIQVYWFCYESNFGLCDVEGNFEGFLYKVNSLESMIKGLSRVSEKSFRNLIYINDDNILKRKI